MNDEYLCVTLTARPSETDGEFADRLMKFWTHVLRNYESEFEKLYAETTKFEKTDDGRWSRQYLAEDSVAPFLERELAAAGIAHDPIDADDRYSKYEAVPPEWMQIDH
ncbi:MAG: hypothetical protein ACRC1K_20250 [Planctomycetia bacterium]